MQLNDEASDEERQLLLPFVTHLACADTPEVERERERYIAARLRWPQSFRSRLAVLERALTIGRQAYVLAPKEVRGRMSAVQQSASTPTSVYGHPLLSKLQGWLAGVF